MNIMTAECYTCGVWCCVLGSLVFIAESMVTGQFYLLEDAKRNYSESVLKCKTIGYDGLAVIDSEVLIHNVLQQLKYPGVEQYWIGMHYSVKKQYHVWDSGVDVTWASWYSGEPNDLPRDRCVRIRTSLNFGTSNCSTNYMAVCGYYSPTYIEFQVKQIKSIHVSNHLWSGTSRSMLDCVIYCMTDVRCKHSWYSNPEQYCVTMSNDFNITSGSQTIIYGSLISKDDADFF